MSELVVLLAPAGPSIAVREVLRDLSAVGLISPFVWVQAVEHPVGQEAAILIIGGEMTATTLQNVGGTQRFDRVRLLSVVPVFTGAQALNSEVEQRVSQLLTSSMGGAPFTRARVILALAGTSVKTEALARAGWLNLFVAPEQSQGPGFGHVVLSEQTPQPDVNRHVAVSIAALAGLWEGMPASPLDDLLPDPGESVRLVRTFHRRLQGGHLGAELRRRVTETAESVPLPVDGGSPSVYIEDTALATGTMSKALWSRHQDVLIGPRDRMITGSASGLGILAALKLFFGFMWAAVKSAPQRWFSSLVLSASSAAAGAAHGVIFGSSPSAYEVVVNGVTKTGLPASWIDLADAADSIEDLLEESGADREHHVITDLSNLWKEYTSGALTLADGGDRVQGLSPVQIGTRRGVVRSVDLIVPSGGARFENVPGHISAQIEMTGVDAFDVLAVNTMHQRLQQLQSDPTIGLDVGRSIEALGAWNQKYRNSYAARVGSELGTQIVKIGAEIKTLLTGLRDAGASRDLPAEIAARQQRLALVLRIIACVAVVLLIATAVVFGFGLIDTPVAAIIGGALVVTWFISSVATFLGGQRDLFRLLNARKNLVANTEIMKRNLRQAVRDIRRLTDAYAQFLEWSRVTGSLLSAPFGEPRRYEEDGSRLAGDLPLQVRLGEATVDEVALADAVAALRRDMFRVGWLDDPWHALIGSAARVLGPEAYDLRDKPDALFSQSGRGDRSLLVKWGDIVVSRGVDASVSNSLWEVAEHRLAGDDGALSSGLLRSIADVGRASSPPIRYEDFMAGVDDAQAVREGGQFDGTVLTDAGRVAGRTAIEHTWGRERRMGLSHVAVLTQLSIGAPPYDFAVFEPRTNASPLWAPAASDLTF